MAFLLMKIIKKDIQERALRILCNTFSVMMSLSGKSTMEVKRLRTLALKAFKTLNNMNPEYMKEIFQNTKQYESRIHEGNISKGSLLYA